MAARLTSTEQVKIWAETLGISNLSEEVVEYIASVTSHRVQSIIDISNRHANMSRRIKILKSDLDSAFQYLNLEPTVEIGVTDFIPIRGVSGVGGKTLFVQDDRDREVSNFVRKPLAHIPPEIALRRHWLALEGKQPALPDNPSPLTKEEQKSKAVDAKRLVKVPTEQAIRKSQMVCIKELATSDLSTEQQQYYKDITEAVIGSIEEKRREALSSLEHDPGLPALVPHLAVFISEGVKVNIVQQNLALLIYIMRMVKALLDNHALYLEPYLHLISPAVSSCIVSKTLCSRPEVDNHWALRGFAAKILSTICKAYETPTNRMTQRLVQMFCHSLDEPTTSLATRYGCYCALLEFGNEVIATMMLPRGKKEGDALQNTLKNTTDPADRKATEKIKELFVGKLYENYLRTSRPSMEKLDDFRAELGPFLGLAAFEHYMKEKTKESARRMQQGQAGVRMASPVGGSFAVNVTGSPGPRLPAASPGIAGMSPGTSSPSPIPRPNIPPQFGMVRPPVSAASHLVNGSPAQIHPHFLNSNGNGS